ncbi:MAG TPA: hypothetical protein VI776_11265 [Anaerolineales bacterium]|nr:hypothetical protein [Anaerolineales bacterium]
MKKKKANRYHINPKFRAYGKARVDIAQRASGPEDWEKLWKTSAYPFPFVWGTQWKQCIEYRADDFAAEVGFFIDILGLPVNAFDPDYAMFTSPAGDFYFSVVPAGEGEPGTPPDAFRIQFMVEDIQETALELERRGIPFEQWPQACVEGSSLYIGYFRTPHGICVDLWGIVEPDRSESQAHLSEDQEEAEFDPDEDLEDPEGLAETSPSEVEPYSEETIHFSLAAGGIDSPTFDPTSAQETLPTEEVESEAEVVELKYEFFDEV